MLQKDYISKTAVSGNLQLKRGKEGPLKRYHPYVFSGALDSRDLPETPGFALLRDADSRALAIVQYNPGSGLCARLFSTAPRDLERWQGASEGEAWKERQSLLGEIVVRKLKESLELRKQLFPAYFDPGGDAIAQGSPKKTESARAGIGLTSGFRWVNAEGDFFPGLILDYYAGAVVLQISTAACELLRPVILASLQDLTAEIPHPLHILERSDGSFRRAENLPALRQWHGESGDPEVWFQEDGLWLLADVEEGQKTGFFLDMREMRILVGALSSGKSVLNLFAYTGGFGLHCWRGGAARLVRVDRSRRAMEVAYRQIARNFPELAEEPRGGSQDVDSLDGDSKSSRLGSSDFPPQKDGHTFICEDVDLYLKQSKELFDIVIVDPPAFAKKKADVSRAVKAYRNLYRAALQRLKPGGLFLACSCSHFIDDEHFQSILIEALGAEQRQGQILQNHRLAPCHPVGLSHREGRYLKSLMLRVY